MNNSVFANHSHRRRFVGSPIKCCLMLFLLLLGSSALAAGPQTSPQSPVSGLSYQYFEGSEIELTDLSQLSAKAEGIASGLDIGLRQREKNYALVFSGFIKVPENKSYTLSLKTKDWGEVYVDGQLMLSRPKQQNIKEKITLDLSEGYHSVSFTHVHFDGKQGFEVQVEARRLNRQNIPDDWYYYDGAVVEPPPQDPDHPAAKLIQGLQYSYYEADDSELVDLSLLTPKDQGAVDDLDLSLRQRDKNYALAFDGFIRIESADTYTFELKNKDWGRLSIDGQLVASQPKKDGVKNKVALFLNAGDHRVNFTHVHFKAKQQFDVYIKSKEIKRRLLPASWLFYDDPDSDSDGDGVIDEEDAFPDDPDEWTDLDGDAVGDNSDPDIFDDGLKYRYFEGTKNELGDLSLLTPVKVGISAGLDLSVRERDEFYAIEYSGVLLINKAGSYRLDMDTKHDSEVVLDNKLILSRPKQQSIKDKITLELSKGAHSIKLVTRHFDRPQSGKQKFELFYTPIEPKKGKREPLPISWLVHPDEGKPDSDGDGVDDGEDVFPNNPEEWSDLDGDGIGDNQDQAAFTPGLFYQYFEGTQAELEDLSLLTPLTSGISDDINLALRQRDQHYALQFDGLINIPTTSRYTFDISNDDETQVTLDGQLLLSHPKEHRITASSSVDLMAGQQPVVLTYTHFSGKSLFELYIKARGLRQQKVKDQWLSHQDAAGNPLAGLLYFYYEGTKSELADLTQLTPLKTGVATELDLSIRQRDSNYAVEFVGFINIEQHKRHQLYLKSKGNSVATMKLYDEILLSRPTIKAVKKKAKRELIAGYHRISVTHIHADGQQNLDLKVKAAGLEHQRIPKSWYVNDDNGQTSDRDGDGVPDIDDAFPDDPSESSDLDGDGVGDNSDPDIDGDGVNNADDAFPEDANESADLDGDGIGDNSDPDKDGDGVLNDDDAFPSDISEWADLDGDGIGDNSDTDRDGDGVLNDSDLFPDDASESADMDGDGIGDNADLDRDGDGVPNSSDAFPNDATESSDLDGDGIGDNSDTDRDGDGVANVDDLFPNDPSESADLDGDGIGDNADTDRDGDGVLNVDDAFPRDPAESSDIDNDGIGDNADTDRDGDGVLNTADTFPNDPLEWADLDGDGTGDNSDLDIDGDGVLNGDDAFPRNPNESSDLDGDGIGDNADTDRDGDGVLNDDDVYPDNPAEWADLDGDGIGDNSDIDRDGDGVANDEDAFPNDASETSDLDGDGIGDNTDTDIDGDGVLNVDDVFPLDPTESADLDGDGIGDNSDLDIDGDNVLNNDDAFPLDPTEWHDLDGDGIGDNSDNDIDNDGVLNSEDAFPTDATEWSDLDADGIGDNSDTDRDGDGVLNVDDAFPNDPTESKDLDGDGIGDNADPDRDGDNVLNEADFYPDDITRSELESVNGLSVSLGGDNLESAVLRWSPVMGENHRVNAYQLFRATATGDFELLTVLDAIENTFVDNAVTNGLGYRYQLLSATASGAAANSGPQVQLFVAYNHLAVTGLSSYQLGADGNQIDDKIDLRWTSTANRFALYRAGAFYTEVSEPAFIDKAVSHGQIYAYQVATRLDFTNPFTDDSFTLDGPLSTAVEVYFVKRLGVLIDDWQLDENNIWRAIFADSDSQFTINGRHTDAIGSLVVTATSGTETVTDSSNDGAFSLALPAANQNRQWTITSIATDNKGQQQGQIRLLAVVDKAVPVINVDGEPSQITPEAVITLTGSVSDDIEVATVVATVNTASGQSFEGSIDEAGKYSVVVPLIIGLNDVTLTVTDKVNRQATIGVTVEREDTITPAVSLFSPVDGAVVNQALINVSGFVTTIQAKSVLQVTLNDKQSVALTTVEPGKYGFTFNDVALSLGRNTLKIDASSPQGSDQKIFTVTYQDKTPPLLQLDDVGSVNTNSESLRLSGQVSDDNSVASVTVTSSKLPAQVLQAVIDSDGRFSVSVALKEGDNQLTFTAKDGSNNTAVKQLGVTRVNTSRPVLTISQPQNGAEVSSSPITVSGFVTTDQPLSQLSLSLNNGAASSFTKVDDNRYQFSFENVDLLLGVNPITIAVDSAKGSDNTILNVFFIDNSNPSILLDSNGQVQTEQSSITIKGTVADNHKVANVVAHSSQYLGQDFGVNVGSDGQFSAQIPLKTGDNQLTFTVTDQSGNSATAVVNVEKADTVTPQLAFTAPVDGAVVTDEVISISGTIVTELTPAQLNVTLSGGLLQDLRLIADKTWQFTFEQYQLQKGSNAIKVQVGYPGGIQNLQMNVFYDDGYQPAPPVITIDAPTPEGSVSGADFTIEGFVSADSPLESLTLNDEAVYLMSGNRFNYPVSFASNSDTITLVMVATDSEQRITTETFTYYRDAQGPQITLNNNLLPLPGVNVVIENPYVVSGTIVDAALSTVLINGQSITVSPGEGENSYHFSVRLPLEKQQTYQLDIKAYDKAGNFTALAYQLLSEQTATIDIIAPSGNSDFISTNSSLDLQILARVNGLSEGDSVRGRVNNQPAEPLAVTETMVNTAMLANIISGENTLVLEVLDSNGAVIASASKLFTVVNPDDVALTLRTEPSNGQTGAEPHGFIGFYFNKAIDISKLTVEVRETLHGLTYIDQDEPGVDITQVKGPALQQTDRDHLLVSGKLSVIPGDNIVAFYPDNNIGYGASVTVQVNYNGEELQRFGYKVRDLPTFVDGTVMDQLNQPVTGIEVSLPELGITTLTDSDGTFGFGYGTTAQSTLPGGVYKLVINPAMKNPIFGTDYRYINIQQGRRTRLRLSRLMLLNVETPFQPVTSGKANVSLANGELTLDLSAAQLTFEDGTSSGNVHVSFLNSQDTNLTYLQGAAPIWLFGLQPAGIKVSGQVGIQIKLPKLFGSLDYVPDSGNYVVLLGRDASTDVMVPIGVGQIDGYTVKSVGSINLQCLDFLAYAIINPDKQTVLAEYANGERSLKSLIGAIEP